jgi:hypothetical protein
VENQNTWKSPANIVKGKGAVFVTRKEPYLSDGQKECAGIVMVLDAYIVDILGGVA